MDGNPSYPFTMHCTRSFVIRSRSGTEIVILLAMSIFLPLSRCASLMPQNLGIFAARQDQVRCFRDQALLTTAICSTTGKQLNRFNSADEHFVPGTVDQLLFKLCHQYLINPFKMRVGSLSGALAVIEDEMLKIQ